MKHIHRKYQHDFHGDQESHDAGEAQGTQSAAQSQVYVRLRLTRRWSLYIILFPQNMLEQYLTTKVWLQYF